MPGLPLNVDGEAVYPMEPEPFADLLLEFVNDFGVRVIGGCCGTREDHIALIDARLIAADLNLLNLSGCLNWPRQYRLSQWPGAAAFLIGERLNTQGSRKFKRLIMAEDFDAIVEMARQQVESGAHGLDLCVALTERADEVDQMRALVKKLANAVPVPLVIDSTEVEVIEAALKANPGRSLINSTHLESGPEKAGPDLFAGKTIQCGRDRADD
jgi:5-methyltetrahydrofolate--homocysteine methyltransferase